MGPFLIVPSTPGWANTAYGPDCEDSPHFRRSNIDELEAMRLFGECGFDFLPETDLQQRPGLDVVMTVGLHLCALELTDHFFLLDAAWVRSRAERPSVSYTKVTSKVAWTSHNLQVTNKLKQQNCGSNKFRKKGGDGKMKRMLEPSIKLIGEVHRMKMSGVRIQMQRRASNSSARRIEKAESKMCVCPPARRTRSTEVMKKGG